MHDLTYIWVDLTYRKAAPNDLLCMHLIRISTAHLLDPFLFCIWGLGMRLKWWWYFTGSIPVPVGVRAEATADNSIRVSWEWSSQDERMCIDSVRVNYQTEGSSLMMYTVYGATTSVTLSNLQCNTQYNISVHAGGGRLSDTTMASLPARGTARRLHIV